MNEQQPKPQHEVYADQFKRFRRQYRASKRQQSMFAKEDMNRMMALDLWLVQNTDYWVANFDHGEIIQE